jgi:hypothetical protein
MSREVPVQAKHLQVGDTLVTRHQPATVVAIDGPDRIGTYDVFVQDNAGNRHMEIVTDVVTIIM